MKLEAMVWAPPSASGKKRKKRVRA